MTKDKRIRYTFVTVLAVMTGWMLACAAIGGKVPPAIILRRMALGICAFAVSFFCFSSDREKTARWVYILLCSYTIAECILGILQKLLIVENRHYIYNLSGNFNNPGPYGALMAFTSVLCFAYLVKKPKKGLAILSFATIALSIVMMLLSKSRAAWLGAMVADILIVIRETAFLSRIKHKALLFSAAAIVAVGAAAGAYALKPDSAKGRFLLWQIDFLAMAEHPLTGVGPGAELGAFCDAQHNFFATNERSLERKMAADNPTFLCNEFLKFGVGGGVPGLILSLLTFGLCLSVLLKRKDPLAYPFIALGIFALFGYPFEQAFHVIFLSLCLGDAASGSFASKRSTAVCGAVTLLIVAATALPTVKEINLKKEIKDFVNVSKPSQRLEDYESRYDRMRYDNGFLALYGGALVTNGDYVKGEAILRDAAAISARPYIHSLLGLSLRFQGRLNEARDEMLYEYWYLPGRLFPLYCLMDMYRACGMLGPAMSIREYAIGIPVDEDASLSLELRNWILEFPDDSDSVDINELF